MKKKFNNSVAVYSVKGGNVGKIEQVLSENPMDAIEVSSIREMGETKATPIDVAPTLRQAVSGIGEPLDFIEWYDEALKEWVVITIDSSLYSNQEIELLSDECYL